MKLAVWWKKWGILGVLAVGGYVWAQQPAAPDSQKISLFQKVYHQNGYLYFNAMVVRCLRDDHDDLTCDEKFAILDEFMSRQHNTKGDIMGVYDNATTSTQACIMMTARDVLEGIDDFHNAQKSDINAYQAMIDDEIGPR